MVKLTFDPILPADLALPGAVPECGAVATFVGMVRGETDPVRGPLLALEYEAYEEMALVRMQAIEAEMQRRWATHHILLIHRLGRLALGEPSVAVVVGTPHRVEAFEACRYGIDRVKAAVPIWKREIWAEGASWAPGAPLA